MREALSDEWQTLAADFYYLEAAEVVALNEKKIYHIITA